MNTLQFPEKKIKAALYEEYVKTPVGLYNSFSEFLQTSPVITSIINRVTLAN